MDAAREAAFSRVAAAIRPDEGGLACTRGTFMVRVDRCGAGPVGGSGSQAGAQGWYVSKFRCTLRRPESSRLGQ